jgi:hypothetical protein
MWLALHLYETMAPLGEVESVVREWGFLLVAIVGRGRGHCARMRVFCWLQEWG